MCPWGIDLRRGASKTVTSGLGLDDGWLPGRALELGRSGVKKEGGSGW
jgi:hypothetical protein